MEDKEEKFRPDYTNDDFKPKFEPIEEDLKYSEEDEKESFEQKISNYKYEMNKKIEDFECEECPPAPWWATICVNLIKIVILPVLFYFGFMYSGDKTMPFICLLVLMIIQMVLVAIYIPPQMYKCSVCGEMVRPSKLLWAMEYNAIIPKRYCPHCQKMRHFTKCK